MHVAFDIDGVLADFSEGFARVLHDLYDIEVPKEVKTWRWSDWVDGLSHGMEVKAWEAIMRDLKYADFWRDLSPLCSIVDIGRINDLAQRNIVSFITNRQAKDQHTEVASVTKIWLRELDIAPYMNTFITADKGTMGRRLGVHLAIEDNGDNVLSYINAGIGCALLRRAYNESYVELVRAKGGYIVDSLEEFLDLCMKFDVRQDDMLDMSEHVQAQRVLWNRPSLKRGWEEIIPREPSAT